MKANVKHNGKTSSNKVEVTLITPKSISLYFNNKEYHLSFKRYPWFEYLTVKELTNVSFDGLGFSWSDTGIDLELAAIQHPEKYPSKMNMEAWLEYRKRKTAASLFGSIKSEAKAKASRENGKLGGRPEKK